MKAAAKAAATPTRWAQPAAFIVAGSGDGSTNGTTGSGSGDGQSGGKGGVATATATGVSDGASSVTVFAWDGAGSGGLGANGVNGGAGAAAIMTNAVRGSAKAGAAGAGRSDGSDRAAIVRCEWFDAAAGAAIGCLLERQRAAVSLHPSNAELATCLLGVHPHTPA